jgi:hypothetical protein
LEVQDAGKEDLSFLTPSSIPAWVRVISRSRCRRALGLKEYFWNGSAPRFEIGVNNRKEEEMAKRHPLKITVLKNECEGVYGKPLPTCLKR